MIAVIVVVLGGLAGGLVYVLSPSSTPPESPQQIAAAAVTDLSAWNGVDYQGVVEDKNGQPTAVRLTISANGSATGTLTRDFGARADFAADSTGTYLRGNQQWWLRNEPGAADELANQWIADPSPDVTSLPSIGRLTPTALAHQLAPAGSTPFSSASSSSASSSASAPASAPFPSSPFPSSSVPSGSSVGLTSSRFVPSALPSAGSTPQQWTETAETAGGQESLLLTDGSRRLTVSTNGSHTPTAATLKLSGSGNSVALTMAQATAAEISAAQNAAGNATGGSAARSSMSSLIPAEPALDGSLTAVGGDTCTTPECQYTVTVTNNGSQLASGTVLQWENGQSLPGVPFTAPAFGTTSVTLTDANMATVNGPTISISILYTFYVPAIMGGDLGLIQRVADRGINIIPSIAGGQPNGAALLKVLDDLTPTVDLNGTTPQNEVQLFQAKFIIGQAIANGSFPALYQVLTSGKLTDTDTAALYTFMSESAGGQKTARMLEDAARLTAAGDTIVLDSSYTPPGSTERYKADVLDLTKSQAIEFQSAESPATLKQEFSSIVDAFQANSPPVVPPGFTKVAWIDVPGSAPNGFGTLTGPDLTSALSGLSLSSVCMPNGSPRVDKIIITDYPAGTTVSTDNDLTCRDFPSTTASPGSGSS